MNSSNRPLKQLPQRLLTHFWVDGAKVTVMCILGDVDVVVTLVFPSRRAIHVSVLAGANTFKQCLCGEERGKSVK